MEVSSGVAAQISAASQETNPANPPARRVTAATRVPMSLPLPKLAVPPIPGFHLHWFRGDNVPTALRAGYEFVEQADVEITQHNVANPADLSGSSDMGSRISIPSGGMTEGGQFERLYLMKLPQEFRDQDMAKLAEVNENVARTIRSGADMTGNPHEIGDDKRRRMMKQGQDLFWPKNRQG